jgi:glycosyltransferase involved in cell wall biosynthesis
MNIQKSKHKHRRGGFGFLFNHHIAVPIHLREYYTSCELMARGHEVVWFCPPHNRRYPFSREIPRVPIKLRQTMFGDIKFYPFYLAHHLLRNNIKYVWLSGWYERDPRYLFYIIFVLKLLGFRLIYDPMDPIYEYQIANMQLVTSRKQSRALLFINAVYHIADITLMVTEEMKTALVRKGAPAKKLHVARWGTDASLFTRKNSKTDWRKRLMLEDKFVIGWLGRMNRFKGIDQIILPLMRILPQYIKNVVFLIGGKGQCDDSFSEALARENLPMILLGEVPYEDAPSFTAALDVYIIPINTETEYGRSIRPIKMIDALAMGVPVIVSDSPATRNIGDVSGSVFYANPDPGSFLNAILCVHDNYSQIKKTAQSNIEHMGKYTHQEVSKEIVDLLDCEL